MRGKPWVLLLVLCWIAGSAQAQVVEFESTVFYAEEGNGALVVTVRPSQAPSAPIQVDLDSIASGNAQPGPDFLPVQTTLQWSIGDASARLVSIPLPDDGFVEPLKDFHVELFNPQGATLGGRFRAAAYILDDDGPRPSSRLRFDRTRYDPGDCVQLQLDDHDENRDPGIKESLLAHVGDFEPQASATLDLETVTLIETGPDTGRFVSDPCLDLVESSAQPDNGILEVNPGDLLSAFYGDPDNPAGSTVLSELDISADTALVGGGSSSGAFQWEVLPEMLDPRLETTSGASPEEAPRPNSVVLDPGGVPLLFGSDQLVYQPATDLDLMELLVERQGSVVETVVVPDPATDTDVVFYVVRFDPSATDMSDFEYLMELNGLDGQHRFGSLLGAQLTAIAVEEQLTGREVTQNPIAWMTGFPTMPEGMDSSGQGDGFRHACSSSAATWLRDPDYGIDRAVVALDIAERNNARGVSLAVIDGGFAAPSDFPGGNTGDGSQLDYGESFGSLIQANCSNRDCSGPANGPNAFLCSGTGACTWHGTGAFSTAAAVAGNGYGSMGVAGHAREPNGTDGDHSLVQPMLYRTGFPFMTTLARAMNRSRADGARIVNVSMGFPCKPLGINICDGTVRTAVSIACSAIGQLAGAVIPGLGVVLELVGCNGIRAILHLSGAASFDALTGAVNAAVADDILITASGPQTIDIAGVVTLSNSDAVSVQMVPCVMSGVTCVGGTDGTAPTSSTAGRGVDLWAPNTQVVATPTPVTGSSTLSCFSGTSAASPFVAGVAAMVRSADPGLSAAEVETLLMETSTPLATPPSMCRVKVGLPECVGKVNAAAAVESALGGALTCSGWDEFNFGGGSDQPASAERLLVPIAPGQVTTVQGDLSIHAIGGDDVDWFIVDVPSAGAPSSRAQFRLHVDNPAHGSLSMELYANPPGGGTPGAADLLFRADTGNNGTAVIGSASLLVNHVYFLKIAATGDAAFDDACYGNTLEIELLAPGPQPDRYEQNEDFDNAATPTEQWVHQPHDPRIFEHEVFIPFSGLGPGDLWTLEIKDLSLHDASDIDWFDIPLPDPASPAWGGYPDVDGDAGIVEPLEECRDYFRRSFHAGETDRIVASGSLILSVNRSSSPGEGLNIANPPLSGGFGYTFNCPRRDYNLTDLLFSIGERMTPRQLSVNYDIQLHYALPAFRIGSRIPAGNPQALPCPGGWFPDCLDELDAAAHRLRHGYTFIDPNCAADGCPEDFIFEWKGGDFDVMFVDDVGLAYGLRKLEGDWIQSGQPFDVAAQAGLNSAAGSTGGEILEQRPRSESSVGNGSPGQVAHRLVVPDLPPDFYLINVTGPEGEFSTLLVGNSLPNEISLTANRDELDWTPALGADAYDVIRGDLRSLVENSGEFESSTLECLQFRQPERNLEYGQFPDPGEAFWFLVRPISGTLNGSYDSGGSGQQRPRDPGISRSGSACM